MENEFVKNPICQLKVFTNFIKVFIFFSPPKAALKSIFPYISVPLTFLIIVFQMTREEIINIIYGKVILYRTFESLLTEG